MSSKPLYLITDGGLLRKRGMLVPAVVRALEGANGAVGIVQLREQHKETAALAATTPASDGTVLEIAKALIPHCKKHGAKLLINRRVDLAKQADCDGVHVGKGSPSVEEIRRELGGNAIVGYSAHSIEELKDLKKRGFDYALLSPIYRPLSKSSKFKPLGLKVLQEAVESSPVPVIALGGISAETATSCMQAGAEGVAMISSILLAQDPAAQARSLAAQLAGACPREN